MNKGRGATEGGTNSSLAEGEEGSAEQGPVLRMEMQVGQGGGAYTNVGPDTPPLPGFSARTCVCRQPVVHDVPGQASEVVRRGHHSNSRPPTPHPMHRVGRRSRAEPRLPRELQDSAFTPQLTSSSPQSEDRCWHKDTKGPQACLPCRHCTRVFQKRPFLKY